MKKSLTRTVSLVVASVAVLALLGNGWAEDASDRALIIKGAKPGMYHVQSIVQGWTALSPNNKVVLTAQSSGAGIQALLSGEIDVTYVARDLDEQERNSAAQKGIQLGEKVIAKVGTSVITSAQNPVNSLTMDQLRKIYNGEITNWAQVGGDDHPIKVVTRPVPEDGMAVRFNKAVLKDVPVTPKALVLERGHAVAQVCSSPIDYAIGIVGSDLDLARFSGKIKVLALKKDDASAALLPTKANLEANIYPLSVPIAFIWNANSTNQKAKSLVKHIETKTGQVKLSQATTAPPK
jgi:phosphate transport system substrate-binding protein